MAVSDIIDPVAMEASMTARFAEIDKTKTDLEGRLNDINKERDELLNKTMEQEVSEDYLRKHFPAYAAHEASGGTKAEFIKGKDASGKYNITMDQKLSIIAQHRNTTQVFSGEDKFSADLSDTQKIKSERKKRYKEDANALMGDYKKILEDCEQTINSIEGLIASKREAITKAEDAITELLKNGAGEDTLMNGSTAKTKKVTQDDINSQINKLKNQKKNLEKEVKELQSKLDKMREIYNARVRDFSQRKNEIDTLLEKGKIFNGAEQQGTQEEPEKNESKETSLASTEEKPTERSIAKSMLLDFFDRSPEEQRTILAQCGSKDILNATRYLGVIQRRKLARVLEERIEEMDGDLTFTGKDGNPKTIRKDELLKRNKQQLSKEQLKAIAEEIDMFNRNFEGKSLDEIHDFEEKIQYIRYACYMQETGWFRNITRHFDSFRNRSNNYKIGEISKTLARYATIKNERERNQVAQLNKWRKTLKLNPMNDLAVTNPRELDRTGQSSIYRQDYHQDTRE